MKKPPHNLRELRDKARMTQAELGKVLGMSQQGYNRIENGTNQLKGHQAKKLAEALGVSLQDILGPQTDNDFTPIEPPQVDRTGFEFQGQTYVGVRVFDIGVSAGPGALNDDHQEPLYYDFYPLSFLQGFTRANVSNLAIVRVVGDSMEPTLRNGDVIMVDMSQTSPTNHGIFVLAIDQETLVKRLQYEMSTKLVSVISDNERYKDEVMPAESLHIIGRVVWAGGVKG